MKRIKRLLALLLTFMLCMGEFASTGLTVSAEGEDYPDTEEDNSISEEADIDAEDDISLDGASGRRGGSIIKNQNNTMLGTAGMAKAKIPMYDSDPWHGSYVYYGRYDGSPVKYRVLDRSTTEYDFFGHSTILLTSDSVLYKTRFDSGSKSWSKSNIMKGLNGEDFLDNDVFSTVEKAALTDSYKSKKSAYDGNGEPILDFAGLNGEKIFLLDAAEATRTAYGFSGLTNKTSTRSNTDTWWLRSSSRSLDSAGRVRADGSIFDDFVYNENGVRPVFNINLSKVMFSTVINGTKGATDAEYKLTLNTDRLLTNISSGQKVTVMSGKVTVPYMVGRDSSSPVVPDALSVMILDKAYNYDAGNSNTANILYLGRLSISGGYSDTGTATFYLPEGLDVNKWGSAYKVYIFAEQTNDDKYTDYAGTPCQITKSDLDIIEGVTVTFNVNGHGKAPEAQIIAKGSRAVKPSDPYEKGWKFKGWYTGYNERGKQYDFNTPVTEDLTLIAHWSSEKVTVTFDNNGGGTDTEAQSVFIGSCATEPEEPVRDGYAFGGWYKDEECTESLKYDFSTPVNANITLYAKWLKKYTVTFDANGGSGSMASIQVAYGNGITLPACEFTAPEDEMVFSTWEAAGTHYPAGTIKKIYQDTVFKATWYKMNLRTVNFYNNYEKYKSVRVKYGEKVEEPAAPKRENATFIGWYTYRAEDNRANDAYRYDFEKPVNSNLDLYAAWTDDTTYHISVKESEFAPGGSITVDKEYVKINDEVTITLSPEEGFEADHLSGIPYYENKFGWVQDAWEVPVEGNTYTFTIPDMTKVSDNEYKNIRIEAYFKVSDTHEHDFEYYDGIPTTCHSNGTMDYVECKLCHHQYEWIKKTDTIGNDITNWPESWRQQYGYHGHDKGKEGIEEKAPTCTVSGNVAYTHCLDCDACLIGPNYAHEGTIEDTVIPIDVNAHEWDTSAITYTWADDNMSVSASCICKHNSTHLLTEEVAVTKTYTKEPTCEEDGIVNYISEAFTNPEFSIQSKTDVTVEKYGHDWDEPEYVWSEDLLSVTASISCNRDSSHTITETAPVSIKNMDGYRICSAEFTNEAFEDQVREIAEVRFDTNKTTASDMPKTMLVNVGDKLDRPEKDPKADGLKFAGWYCEEECIRKYDFDAPVKKDTVLYARFIDEKAVLFTVSFNMLGHGDAVAPQEVEAGKSAVKPADPSEYSWIFKGWYTDAGCKASYDFSTAVSSDITLYAGWEKDPMIMEGGRSALDSVPELNSSTTELNLVKGQKFNIPQGWYLDKGNKADKKIISISKSGVFKAKKDGRATIYCGADKAVSVNVIVHKPAITKDTKKLKLDAGKTGVIKIEGYDADKMPVLFYSASPDVATVDESGVVTAVAKGTAKISVFINGKEFKASVLVSEPETAKNRTMHVAVGSQKTIKVKGVKNWSSASSDIAEMNKKGSKVKAVNAGRTVLSASANGVVYTMDFYSEDLTLTNTEGTLKKAKGTNKYTLELKKGTETNICFSDSVDQDMIFKSSKADIAFIDEYGRVTARSKGKCKFTAKADGKTITITVNVM